jgi:hypothetical protein
MMKPLYPFLFWITLFAIAMAYMESAVVVYLRAVWYPGGFEFPLKVLDYHIVVTEFLREAATMIMLISIAVIAVKEAISRFAVFIFAFAVWDIFYYVFLWFLLGWPPSLMTWDILFLIPVTWVGPVIAPVINSITMILLALVILSAKRKEEHFSIHRIEWCLLILGSFVVIYAYIQPYLQFLLSRYSFGEILHFREHPDLITYSGSFVPVHFSWIIFSMAEILFLVAIVNIVVRNRKQKNIPTQIAQKW